MPRFHCRIPGFKFTAFQPGADPLPAAAPVATLERKVGPGYRDVTRTLEVEVVPSDGGKPRKESQVQKTRERVARVTQGRGVLRETMEVEAENPIMAAAVFRKVAGITEKGTSREVEVKPAVIGGEVFGGAPAAPLSADEVARQLVGGNVPLEE